MSLAEPAVTLMRTVGAPAHRTIFFQPLNNNADDRKRFLTFLLSHTHNPVADNSLEAGSWWRYITIDLGRPSIHCAFEILSFGRLLRLSRCAIHLAICSGGASKSKIRGSLHQETSRTAILIEYRLPNDKIQLRVSLLITQWLIFHVHRHGEETF